MKRIRLRAAVTSLGIAGTVFSLAAVVPAHAASTRTAISTTSLNRAGVAVTRAQGAGPFVGSCGVMHGITANLAVTHHGIAPQGGTIFIKTNSKRCHNLSIIAVGATDRYEGWLLNSRTGNWSHCRAGFVRITRGSHVVHPVALCTNVKATTQMAVVAISGHHRHITVQD